MWRRIAEEASKLVNREPGRYFWRCLIRPKYAHYTTRFQERRLRACWPLIQPGSGNAASVDRSSGGATAAQSRTLPTPAPSRPTAPSRIDASEPLDVPEKKGR